MRVYCKCDHCGIVREHSIVRIMYIARGTEVYRVKVAKCSSCGEEFEATHERLR